MTQNKMRLLHGNTIKNMVVLLFIASITFSGCVGTDSDIPGTYVQEGTDNFLKLDESGTFLLDSYGKASEGKWRVEGDTLYMTIFWGTIKSEIKDGVIIDPEGDRWIKT